MQKFLDGLQQQEQAGGEWVLPPHVGSLLPLSVCSGQRGFRPIERSRAVDYRFVQSRLLLQAIPPLD